MTNKNTTPTTDRRLFSATSCSRLFRWLKLPKFAYVNWHKAAPNASPVCWKQWFSIKRYWGGKLVYLEIRHHSLQFDFRRDWLADFIGKPPQTIREKLDWPTGSFRVVDEPGEHDPCYLVGPNGLVWEFNHHAVNGFDQARAQWFADTLNAALSSKNIAAEYRKVHAALVRLDGIYRHDMDHPGFRPDWLRDALSSENV